MHGMPAQCSRLFRTLLCTPTRQITQSSFHPFGSYPARFSLRATSSRCAMASQRTPRDRSGRSSLAKRARQMEERIEDLEDTLSQVLHRMERIERANLSLDRSVDRLSRGAQRCTSKCPKTVHRPQIPGTPAFVRGDPPTHFHCLAICELDLGHEGQCCFGCSPWCASEECTHCVDDPWESMRISAQANDGHPPPTQQPPQEGAPQQTGEGGGAVSYVAPADGRDCHMTDRTWLAAEDLPTNSGSTTWNGDQSNRPLPPSEQLNAESVAEPATERGAINAARTGQEGGAPQRAPDVLQPPPRPRPNLPTKSPPNKAPPTVLNSKPPPPAAALAQAPPPKGACPAEIRQPALRPPLPTSMQNSSSSSSAGPWAQPVAPAKALQSTPPPFSPPWCPWDTGKPQTGDGLKKGGNSL